MRVVVSFYEVTVLLYIVVSLRLIKIYVETHPFRHSFSIENEYKEVSLEEKSMKKLEDYTCKKIGL